MRRKLLLSACMLAVVLTACGSKEEEMAVSETDTASGNEAEEESNDSSMQLIADNIDQWWPEQTDGITYAVTVTDLDRNDRPEVIVSDNGNSGDGTWSKIYEVNENGDGIEEITYSFVGGTDDDSQPDIVEDSLRVYCKEDQYYYIADDYTRNGAGYHSCRREVLSKKDTAIEVEELAFLEAQYVSLGNDEMGYEISISDAEGSLTDLNSYRNADSDRFDGSKQMLATLKWEYISDPDKIDADILQGLFEAFCIDESSEPDNMYYDPDQLEDKYEVKTAEVETEYSLDKVDAALQNYNSSLATNTVVCGDTVCLIAGTADGNLCCSTQRGDTLDTYIVRVMPDGNYLFSGKEGKIYWYDGTASEEAMNAWWASFIEVAGAADSFFVKADFRNALADVSEEQVYYTLVDDGFDDAEDARLIVAHYETGDKEYLFYIDPDTDEMVQCSLTYGDGTIVGSTSRTFVLFPDAYDEVVTDDFLNKVAECNGYVSGILADELE